MLQERKWMGRAVNALRNFSQSRARCTGPLRWLRQGFAVLGNCCACGVNKRAASYRFLQIVDREKTALYTDRCHVTPPASFQIRDLRRINPIDYGRRIT